MRLESLNPAQFVTTRPGAAEILTRHGLDLCSRGQSSCAAVCEQAGIVARDAEAKLAHLEGVEAIEYGWSRHPLSELIDHIIEHYHQPLRRDIPALIKLAKQVELMQVDKPRCPTGLAAHLQRILDAVENHLAKEEHILFPLIRAGHAHATKGSIKTIIREHEDHGENLRLTRSFTRTLEMSPEGCAGWRALYGGLARLESGIWKHIFLENYVLFPRVLKVQRVDAQARLRRTTRLSSASATKAQMTPPRACLREDLRRAHARCRRHRRSGHSNLRTPRATGGSPGWYPRRTPARGQP